MDEVSDIFFFLLKENCRGPVWCWEPFQQDPTIRNIETTHENIPYDLHLMLVSQERIIKSSRTRGFFPLLPEAMSRAGCHTSLPDAPCRRFLSARAKTERRAPDAVKRGPTPLFLESKNSRQNWRLAFATLSQ